MKHIIYFHCMKPPDAPETVLSTISWLSKHEQDKLTNFHRNEDKSTVYIGKLLLRYGLKKLGFKPDLTIDIKYTDQKRPYLDIPWDFNITHCDDLIAIVFAENKRVGLDVEKVEELNLHDFQNCFVVPEWNDILSAKDQYSRFFYYWTRKEAVLKAVGSGLLIHPSLFSAIENYVVLEHNTWFLHQVEVKKEHVCFLATEDTEPEITLHEIKDPFIYS
jgi:4'-phosphopantetheinyl transferase